MLYWLPVAICRCVIFSFWLSRRLFLLSSKDSMPLLSYFPEYSRLQVCSFVLQSWFFPILRIHRLSTTPSDSRPHWPCFEAGHFQFYDYSRFSTAPSGSRPILSYDHAFLRPSFASKVTYGSVRLLPVPGWFPGFALCPRLASVHATTTLSQSRSSCGLLVSRCRLHPDRRRGTCDSTPCVEVAPPRPVLISSHKQTPRNIQYIDFITNH